MESKSEQFVLSAFAGALVSHNLDVRIEICSQVTIHNEGGLCRWIPNNLNTADTTLVVLTPSYLDALSHGSLRDGVVEAEEAVKVEDHNTEGEHRV